MPLGVAQVVIVPIVKKEADAAGVMHACEALHAAAQQAGLRSKLDATTEKTPGWKFNHYEMKVLPFSGLHAKTLLHALTHAACSMPTFGYHHGGWSAPSL